MPKDATKPAKKEKKGGKKDPDAPKRPLSAYMFFSKDNRDSVKSENPDVSFGEIGKLLGARWKSLSEIEKKKYEEMAARDKQRHETEKAAYEGK